MKDDNISLYYESDEKIASKCKNVLHAIVRRQLTYSYETINSLYFLFSSFYFLFFITIFGFFV